MIILICANKDANVSSGLQKTGKITLPQLTHPRAPAHPEITFPILPSPKPMSVRNR